MLIKYVGLTLKTIRKRMAEGTGKCFLKPSNELKTLRLQTMSSSFGTCDKKI